MATDMLTRSTGDMTSSDGAGGFHTADGTVTPTIAATYSAVNDVNGNPRRVWVGYSDRGAILAASIVQYGNPPAWHRDARTQLPSVVITPGEFRDWERRIEDNTGAYGLTDPTDDSGYVWARYSTAARARRAITRDYAWHRPMTVCHVTVAGSTGA